MGASEDKMSDEDMQQLHEAVIGMKQIGNVFDEIITLQAAMTKKTFDAFVKAGFTQEQALTLTAVNKSVPKIEIG